MSVPANSDFPESASIVSRWKLDDPGTWADSVGTNTLTAANMAGGSGHPSGFNASADFESSSSPSLLRADNAGLSITGDLSFSILVNQESAPATDALMVLMSKFDGPNDKRSYEFGYRDVSTTKQLYYRASSDGLSGTLVTKGVAQTLTLGTWFILGVVYDASAGEVDFYVNGAAVGTTQTAYPTSVHDNDAAFILGADNAAASLFYDGLMQDAVLWNVELTSANMATIATLYPDALPMGSPIFFT